MPLSPRQLISGEEVLAGRLSRQLIFEWRRTLATGREAFRFDPHFILPGRFSYGGFGRQQLVPRILACRKLPLRIH